MILLELLEEAGCPPGVVNVIHGTHDPVNFICDHPDIKAVSFVGSDQAVSLIYLYSRNLSFFPIKIWNIYILGPIYI